MEIGAIKPIQSLIPGHINRKTSQIATRAVVATYMPGITVDGIQRH